MPSTVSATTNGLHELQELIVSEGLENLLKVDPIRGRPKAAQIVQWSAGKPVAVVADAIIARARFDLSGNFQFVVVGKQRLTFASPMVITLSNMSLPEAWKYQVVEQQDLIRYMLAAHLEDETLPVKVAVIDLQNGHTVVYATPLPKPEGKSGFTEVGVTYFVPNNECLEARKRRSTEDSLDMARQMRGEN